MLTHVANNLPFKAIAVSHEMMEEMAAQEEKNNQDNLNPYTKKYVIQNNLNACHDWLKPIDHHFFGEYV